MQIGNLTQALALTNPPSESILDAIKDREARRRELAVELELITTGAIPPADAERVQRTILARAAEVRALLTATMAKPRQILRQLLVGRLRCTPFEEADGRRGYRFTGEGTYEAVLPAPTVVVAPTGFEPVFQP